jgi:signal recognition particle GTPase
MLAVSNAVKPDNVVFVMDASIGQVTTNAAYGEWGMFVRQPLG